MAAFTYVEVAFGFFFLRKLEKKLWERGEMKEGTERSGGRGNFGVKI